MSVKFAPLPGFAITDTTTISIPSTPWPCLGPSSRVSYAIVLHLAGLPFECGWAVVETTYQKRKVSPGAELEDVRSWSLWAWIRLQRMATTATHTVIVGSGIIGISTAYYLSHLALRENPAEVSDGDAQDTKQEHHIHLVDPAPVLFEHVASGKAGGFLARNGFSPSAAELGAFSFDLHKQLAERFDGRNKWGWSQTTVIDLDIMGSPKKGNKNRLGEGWDWIQSGESRVTAAKSSGDDELGEYPPWLNNFSSAQPLGGRRSAAQL